MADSTLPRPGAPRIAPTETTPEGYFEGSSGTAVNIARTLALHPELADRFRGLVGPLARGPWAPERFREVIVLRVGWRARSVYEFGQHTLYGRGAGLTEDEIRALTLPVDEGSWGAEERLLVQMVDELVDHDVVLDDTWAGLSARWDDASLMRMVLLAGSYRMVSGFLNTAGVQLDEGVPGWPEGAGHDRPRPARTEGTVERPRAPRIAPSDSIPDSYFDERGTTARTIVRTIARDPDLAPRFSGLVGFLARRSATLPPREREIVILRVGWRARAVYEFGQHTLFGRAAGLTDEEIRRTTLPADAPGWTDDERALVQMVDDLTDEDCVSDATWARLQARWDVLALIELLLLAGSYRMVSWLLNSAGVQLEPDVPGWPATG